MSPSDRNPSVPAGAPAPRPRERGTSLVETVVAIAVLGTIMAAAMAFIVTSWRYSQLNREKVFAYEKAVSILTEMQAYLETSGIEAASDLDSFDDGTSVRTPLTITRDPADPTIFVPPNHPASGNITVLGNWRWSRRIQVRPFPGVNTRDLRIVTVEIYRAQDGDDPTVNRGTQYARVSSVLRTIADAFPTTQVYDIYLLAVENVPGWWVFMDAIKPFIETTIDDLQSRNPGLRFRTHWITKNGYGRDAYYRPYWNFTNHSRQATPWVHFYPATMPPLVVGDVASAYYYVPETVQAWIRNETGFVNGWNNALTTVDGFGNTIPNPVYNPFPYTLADHWNHAMRSVDEEAYFRLRRDFGGAVADSVGAEDDAEPTWHLLLDRMKSSPTLYRNAIFINLHGELLPMPPMRGVSDPAKDPRPSILGPVVNEQFYSMDANPLAWAGGHPGVRVVTHPEQQRYVRGATPAVSEDVVLRVHAWQDDPERPAQPDILSDPIEIQIFGVDLASRTEQLGGGWINLGFIGAPAVNRATWTGCWFRNAWGQNPIAGNGYLRIEACRGGVNVVNNGTGSPSPAPDGVTDPYAWYQPYVVGLGEYSINNSFPFAATWPPYNSVTSPLFGVPPYTVSTTTRPEGFFCGYAQWPVAGSWTYNGALPTVRCGYVPPELDPEGVGYTLVRLYNTPLRTRLIGGQGVQGLETGNAVGNYRLYGREYIPTATELANNFTQDLTNATAAAEKNTARWRLTIRRDALGLGLRVRNASTGTWVSITAADPTHPSDPNDSDHWPVTVTTRIGSRVQDYNNDGRVNPADPRDVEEYYIHNGWNPWNAVPTAFTVMEVIDRALYNGATWPDPAGGPTAFTYTGGLKVRIPDGLELPVNTGNRQALAGGYAWLGSQNRPENLSTTYWWWTDSTNDVPASEQAQFLGDPRHCPYKDFKAAGVNFPNAYNWYFDNMRNAVDGNPIARWPGFDAGRIKNTAGDTSEGWMSRYEIDLPRMMKVLRESLANANMLWTTLTGFSYYYVGIGNEIGYDSANGYNNSIPVNAMPFGGTAVGTGYEQSITSGGPGGTWGSGVKLVRSLNAARWLFSGGIARSYWWGANWIGEQYPDDMYGVWARDGNLPAGNTLTDFARVNRSNIFRNSADSAVQPISLPYGTRFSDRVVQRRSQEEGCTTFFNIGTSGPHSTFHHTFQSSVDNGTLTAGAGGGQDLANNYSFPLPTRTKISRPFDINLSGAGGIPDEFNFLEFSGTRYQAFRVMRLYDHDNGQVGSGLILNRNPANTNQAAYILVNGIDRATESGSAFISRYSMVSLIHSFLVGGFTNAAVGVTATNRIVQLPRVQIVSPTILSQLEDPVNVTCQFNVTWRRWDGQPYTNQYAAGFAENEGNLSYVPMWSGDGGTTWISMIDNATPVTPGTRPTNPALLINDAAAGADEIFLWSTPAATFPRASYLVRVDSFRGANALHYSFHQERIYIDR